jgi:ABC-type nitrate/sulfonate/bicarbonate transport system permease component
MRRLPWLGLLVVGVCLAAWEAAARARPDLAVHFPPASAVLLALADIVRNGDLAVHARASLRRFAEGYLLASVLAVGGGLILGMSRRVHAMVEPLVELLRPMPSVAIIPVAILFLGIGDEMKIAVTVYACSWPILLNTIDGVRSVDHVLVSTAATFRLSRWQRFWKVMLPAASPQIVTGLRISLAIALVLVTTSEMVVSNDGLGYYVLDLQRSFQTAEMYGAVVALGLIGYVLNRLFLLLDARVMGWYRGATRKEEIL